MARINNGTLKDWHDGDKFYAASYKQDQEILRIAINDNDKNIKDVLDANTTLEQRVASVETKNVDQDDQLRGIETGNMAQDSRLHALELIIDRFFWSGEEPDKLSTGSIYDESYGQLLVDIIDTLFIRSAVSANMFVANAAPTSGYRTAGDIVWNGKPTPGGKVGWICTTSGNPGTWKAFGPIDV